MRLSSFKLTIIISMYNYLFLKDEYDQIKMMSIDGTPFLLKHTFPHTKIFSIVEKVCKKYNSCDDCPFSNYYTLIERGLCCICACFIDRVFERTRELP